MGEGAGGLSAFLCFAAVVVNVFCGLSGGRFEWFSWMAAGFCLALGIIILAEKL